MKRSTDEPLSLELDDATLFCDVDATVDPTTYRGGEHEPPHGATLEGV